MVTIAEHQQPVAVEDPMRYAIDQLARRQLIEVVTTADGTTAAATERGRSAATRTKRFREQHGYPG